MADKLLNTQIIFDSIDEDLLVLLVIAGQTKLSTVLIT